MASTRCFLGCLRKVSKSHTEIAPFQARPLPRAALVVVYLLHNPTEGFTIQAFLLLPDALHSVAVQHEQNKPLMAF